MPAAATSPRPLDLLPDPAPFSGGVVVARGREEGGVRALADLGNNVLPFVDSLDVGNVPARLGQDFVLSRVDTEAADTLPPLSIQRVRLDALGIVSFEYGLPGPAEDRSIVVDTSAHLAIAEHACTRPLQLVATGRAFLDPDSLPGPDLAPGGVVQIHQIFGDWDDLQFVGAELRHAARKSFCARRSSD